MFDQIEKLKRDFTDKYVIVDAKQPELKRFHDQVGLVKTVNMSGRALVEFQDYINNIGWYDIDLSFLKVVDKPPEKKVEAKEKPAKPAADKPAAAKPAAAQAAAPAAAGAKKQSVAEILAAARTKGGAPVAPAKPAAAKAATAAPVAKAEPGKKLSTADILAAARAKAAGGGAPAAPTKPAPVKKEAALPPVEEPVAVEPEVEVATPAPVAEKKPAAAQGALPKAIPEILAFCRRVDHDRISRV